ncbi:MAG: CNP1-like family protein [Burkholderiales bacterium]
MRFVKVLVGALLASGVLATADAVAQELPLRDSAADTIDFSEKPLEENKAKLPAAPRPEDLIRFDMGPTHRGFEYFVDGATLSVGEDGIIRYTLVVKSDMGASNVTFQGIRCATRERKDFAYGRRDGSWVQARNPEWRKIGTPGVEGPVYVLYNEFFCPARNGVSSAGEAVAALKRGEHPRATGDVSSGFTPLGQ